MALDRERTSREEEEKEDAMVELAASRGETRHANADQARLTGRVIKRVRELTRTMDEHERATNALTERIRKLNVWLLAVTIAIGAMTLVQAGAAALTLWRAWR